MEKTAIKKPEIEYIEVQCTKCNGSGATKIIEHTSLRKLREFCDISLREMAKKIGCSVGYLSDVERGNRSATERIYKEYKKL